MLAARFEGLRSILGTHTMEGPLYVILRLHTYIHTRTHTHTTNTYPNKITKKKSKTFLKLKLALTSLATPQSHCVTQSPMLPPGGGGAHL